MHIVYMFMTAWSAALSKGGFGLMKLSFAREHGILTLHILV